MLVVLQGLTGWTIGKLITGLRVVGEDGRAPGLGKALLRWVLWVLDGFPYVLPLVGGIVALTTVGHRRVGDMAAKPSASNRVALGRRSVVRVSTHRLLRPATQAACRGATPTLRHPARGSKDTRSDT